VLLLGPKYERTPFPTALLVHSCQWTCPDSGPYPATRVPRQQTHMIGFSCLASSPLRPQQYPDTNPKFISAILMHSILYCSRGGNSSQRAEQSEGLRKVHARLESDHSLQEGIRSPNRHFPLLSLGSFATRISFPDRPYSVARMGASPTPMTFASALSRSSTRTGIARFRGLQFSKDHVSTCRHY
jgi:hypothetical protein